MKAPIKGRNTSGEPISGAQSDGAAARALAEAEERRRALDIEAVRARDEIGGREGPDPVRYGDWEVRGLASDF